MRGGKGKEREGKERREEGEREGRRVIKRVCRGAWWERRMEPVFEQLGT